MRKSQATQITETLAWLCAGFPKKQIDSALFPGERRRPARAVMKARCATAVKLRERGMKFREIGVRMKVSPDRARQLFMQGVADSISDRQKVLTS